MRDAEMRESLFQFLDWQHEKIRVFEEKTMGRSRCDMFTVTEKELVGYEIKSDRDTYTRLPSQIKDYNKYFDRNYIVVGKSHLKQVDKHIPTFWGIICVFEEDGVVLVEKTREAGASPNAKIKLQLHLMWRRELNSILKTNNLPKYAQKSRSFVEEKLIEKLDESTLKKCMCDELLERDYSQFEQK